MYILSLIKTGGSPDIPTRSDKNTPLSLACHGNQLDALRLLLRYPCDVNVKDKDEDTPLHYTTCLGNYEATNLLLQHGADPEAQSRPKTTPLWYAVYSGNPRLVNLLLQYNVPLQVASRGVFQHTSQPATVPIFDQERTPLRVVDRLAEASVDERFLIFRMLILAGARCDNEAEPWLRDVRTMSVSDYTGDFVQSAARFRLKVFLSLPMSLKCVARVAIRSLLGKRLHEALPELELPRDLKDYLLLKEL